MLQTRREAAISDLPSPTYTWPPGVRPARRPALSGHTAAPTRYLPYSRPGEGGRRRRGGVALSGVGGARLSAARSTHTRLNDTPTQDIRRQGRGWGPVPEHGARERRTGPSVVGSWGNGGLG